MADITEHYTNIQHLGGSLYYVTGKFPDELYATVVIDTNKVRNLDDNIHFRKVLEECKEKVYYIRTEYGWHVILAFENPEDRYKFQLIFSDVQE